MAVRVTTPLWQVLEHVRRPGEKTQTHYYAPTTQEKAVEQAFYVMEFWRGLEIRPVVDNTFCLFEGVNPQTGTAERTIVVAPDHEQYLRQHMPVESETL